MRLGQHQHLEHLVERAEPAGEENGPGRIFYEHRLSDEKVAELDAEVHPGIGVLLAWKLDGKPYRSAAGKGCAAVGCLHDAGASAGDHGDAPVGELSRNLHGVLVIRVAGLGAG